ncbi:MFS transporter [Massilia psychrophila]|uniref:MFS transporter n=1 Tax=Massilia psychrophila TaxID=1603353 RepID=UPI0019B5B807|nr:hypothetical protein GCM10008020_32090 [Massilia psychrophila]
MSSAPPTPPPPAGATLAAAVEGGKRGGWDSFKAAAANYRVWLLFSTYGACFGIEIFIHNIAAVYYVDHFGLSLGAAGSFGLLALFARALGGYLSDKGALRGNLNSRVTLLFVLMIGEGIGLLWFANAGTVTYAVIAMLCFGLFTHMACGATYALVPFIDSRALGGVAGIIGAVLYGDVKDGPWYFDLILNRTDISAMRRHLLFGEALCAQAA